jgi:sugar-specific transcriptional regulator TrmB
LYIALARLSHYATANALSEFSKVARQDVYRILEELQNLGLVEKVIANPAKFMSIPIKDAISILLKRRRERTLSLAEESTELLTEFLENDSSIALQERNQFVLIPTKEAVIRRVEKAIKATNEKIRAITSWREFTQWDFILHELWKQAIKRGVRVYWITEKPRNLDSRQVMAHVFSGDPNFKRRSMTQQPKGELSIYDDREVFIETTRQQNAGESSVLWMDNPAIIGLLGDYFELRWKLASDCGFKE